jgi:adenosylcobinamide amidohydrolase
MASNATSRDAVRLDGVRLDIGPEAVVVESGDPLRVASTAVVNGGLAAARAIINLHVSKHHACDNPATMIAGFAGSRRLPPPWIGLLTAAWTEYAEVGYAHAGATRVMVVATVGLTNRFAAGAAALPGPVPAAEPGTVNIIVVADADPTPAALLNAMLVVTEVKTSVLLEAGIVCDDGRPATGTSTDAVVLGATGRGAAHEFGGPATELGWGVARATRDALVRGIARWTLLGGALSPRRSES